MAIPVILDVDPGSDDAVAMMLAIKSDLIDLQAVCTVAGNKSIEHTTENALRLIQKMNVDVPVYKGCGRPVFMHLLDLPEPANNKIDIERDGQTIQMHDDYLKLEPATIEHESVPAAAFYVQYLREATEPVTIILTGPVSNLALALMLDASIVKNISEVIIMGGGDALSNITSSAEANIYHDPHALAWILNSGVRLTMVPLDATHMAPVTAETCRELREINTFSTVFAADLVEQRMQVYTETDSFVDEAPVHDALAVCALINPDVLTDCPRVHMDVETMPGKAFGQTIVDHRLQADDLNCFFALGADKTLFNEMLKDILAR